MDPMAMKAYTQRVAPQYEFAKMYGGKSLEDLYIDDDMFAAGKSIKETTKSENLRIFMIRCRHVLENETAVARFEKNSNCVA